MTMPGIHYRDHQPDHDVDGPPRCHLYDHLHDHLEDDLVHLDPNRVSVDGHIPVLTQNKTAIWGKRGFAHLADHDTIYCGSSRSSRCYICRHAAMIRCDKSCSMQTPGGKASMCATAVSFIHMSPGEQ